MVGLPGGLISTGADRRGVAESLSRIKEEETSTDGVKNEASPFCWLQDLRLTVYRPNLKHYIASALGANCD